MRRKWGLYLVATICLALVAGYFAIRTPPGPLARVPVADLQRIEQLGYWPAKLVEALDLNRPGFEQARALINEGDLHGSCREILRYFLDRPRPFIDIEPVYPFRDAATAQADAWLQDQRVRLQNTWGPVLRDENGRIDWDDRGPRDDLEWTWMLNRQGVSLALIEAYTQTGNLDYLHAAEDMVIDWITSHPVPKFPDFIGPWRALEAARRMDEAYRPLLVHHPHAAPLSESAHLLLLASLAEHGDYLVRFHALEGNHLLTEMTKLLHLALLFPEYKNAPQWKAYALEKLKAETERQVYPDGAHKELSNHYQRVILRNYQRTYDLLVRAEETEALQWFRPRFEDMWDYFAWMTKPDGSGVLNNDSDREPNARILAAGVRQFNRQDWRYVATGGREGTPNEGPLSRVFPWAGHAILRDGWAPDSHWAYFDMGFHGTDHQQYDRLHLSLSVGAPGAVSQNILVDNGRYTYRPGWERDYFVGPRAHNVILVDGQGSERPPLQALEPVPHYAHLEADYDFLRADAEFAQMGRHVRGVFHKRGEYWLIFDGLQVYGHHAAETLWHFAPEIELSQDARGLRAEATGPKAGGIGLRMIPLPETDSEWTLTLSTGWHSVEYNEKAEAPMATYASRLAGPRTVAWLLWPEHAGSPGLPEFRRLEAPPGSVAVELSWPDGRTDQIAARLFGPKLPSDWMGTSNDGQFAFRSQRSASVAQTGR
ncbi:MAG: heparinase II/III family protein [Opitutales bacterium]